MKNYPFAILLVLFFITSASRCNKACYDPTNPDCGNYDACYGQKPVSAAFKIQETLQRPSLPDGWGETLDTDTITTYGVQFTALEEGAEYEWHIGSEVLKGKSVTRTNFPQFATYPITLIVKKTPNTACFPNDDGRDTVTRNMYAGSWLVHTPFFGKFKGTVTNPNDTLTIDIHTEKFNSGGIIVDRLVPSNWGCKNNDCDFANGGTGDFTFKKIKFSFAYIAPNCKSPIGIFEIRGKNNDTLVINYDEFRVFGSSDLKDRVTRKFVGVRQK